MLHLKLVARWRDLAVWGNTSHCFPSKDYDHSIFHTWKTKKRRELRAFNGHKSHIKQVPNMPGAHSFISENSGSMWVSILENPGPPGLQKGKPRKDLKRPHGGFEHQWAHRMGMGRVLALNLLLWRLGAETYWCEKNWLVFVSFAPRLLSRYPSNSLCLGLDTPWLAAKLIPFS